MKDGNTYWLKCARCATWWPVSPVMLRPDAPDCRCPKCGVTCRAVERLQSG